jgi:hypothetical protein
MVATGGVARVMRSTLSALCEHEEGHYIHSTRLIEMFRYYASSSDEMQLTDNFVQHQYATLKMGNKF